eukprot:GHVR01170094.1.p1 GENE.GHVR01170094.1~~GHVR01170094.1.p1  ORF type:complete len:123 (-),score=12.84 GHVR01170094.1:6-374(-)
MLSHWLESVKTNNSNMYDSLCNPISKESIANDIISGKFFTPDQGSNNFKGNDIPPHLQEQQLTICLINQINIYRDLLGEISYQNQLLSQSIGLNHQNQWSQMNFSSPDYSPHFLQQPSPKPE